MKDTNKLQVGDVVRIIASVERLEAIGLPIQFQSLVGEVNRIDDVEIFGFYFQCCVSLPGLGGVALFLDRQDLELVTRVTDINKFQIGDRVKVVADGERLKYIGVPGQVQRIIGEVTRLDGRRFLKYRVSFKSNGWWYFDEKDLELAGADVDEGEHKCKTCKHWREYENTVVIDNRAGFRFCDKLEKGELLYCTCYHTSSYGTHPDFGCILWEENRL